MWDDDRCQVVADAPVVGVLVAGRCVQHFPGRVGVDFKGRLGDHGHTASRKGPTVKSARMTRAMRVSLIMRHPSSERFDRGDVRGGRRGIRAAVSHGKKASCSLKRVTVGAQGLSPTCVGAMLDGVARVGVAGIRVARMVAGGAIT